MRNMKLKYYLAAVSVLIGLSVTAQQGKSKDNQGKDKTEVVKEGKSQKDVENDIEETKKGNAYGKNKGELEGKDFGQDRAEQARLEHKEKLEKLDKTIYEEEEKVKEAKEKIKKSKDKLEKDKNKIFEKEYKEREVKIKNAEDAVKDLEESLDKGKKLKKEKQ